MIHVAIASDDAYVPWTATLMRSILDHHVEGSVVFHLMHDGIRVTDLDRLGAFVAESGGELDPHEIDRDALAGLPGVHRFPPIVWSRFLLPDLLSEQPRVLYLDADTFVVEPLDALHDAPLDEPIAAVANVVEPSLHEHVRALGGDPTSFFNSGVLVMNLDAMRGEDTLSRLRSFLAAEQRLRWPDQDALNVLFAGRWKRLHPRWNAMNSFWTWPQWAAEAHGRRDLEEARAEPAILHFEGPTISKPWHHLCSHSYRAAYRETLRRTPFGDAPIEGVTLANRIVHLLPADWWTPAFVRMERFRGRLGRLGRS